MAYIAWATTGFYGDVRASRTLTLLSDVLQLRLIAEIREKQGTTYSPSVGHSPSTTFADYGYLSASIQAPPDKLAGFLSDAQKIARDLRDTPVTPDELDRARRPSLASITRARGSSNGWWLGNLGRVQADPRVAAAIASQIADYESVTPADLQRVARRYLGDARAWKVVVVPEALPAAASR
jgi:zinc protease